MRQLQEYLADYFPDRFNPDTWQDLLPEFINAQIALYQERVAGHELEMAEWAKSDQSTAAPTLPIIPLVFALACEEQAKREGLTFRSLACSVYIGRDRIDYYRKRMNHYKQMCDAFDEASMELVEEHLALKASITSGTSIRKRNN